MASSAVPPAFPEAVTPAPLVSSKVVTPPAASLETNNPAAMPVATLFVNNPIDIAPDYEGRATMEVDVNRRVSTLHLKKVTLQDSRSFQCSVTIPNDDEGITAATTSLLVLVAPSAPICTLQGSAEYFHNITLTCKSEEGSPDPTYAWKSYSISNSPRPFPPKTTEKDGVLSLINITKDTSGYFVCTSTNRIDSAKCNVTLSVMPSSMNIGSTAIIIGAVLAGVAVVGILIFCLCRRRNQKKKNAERYPEDTEFQDRHEPETGKPYMDDKSNSENKHVNQHEDKEDVPQNYSGVGPAGRKLDDDQQSYNSDKRSEISSQRYQKDQHDRYPENYNNQSHRERYGGSRDRLDDQRERYGGSRDRLDDQRERYGGSRDRLDDQRERYGGSRDRLDDRREHYGGSREHLDDHREHYGGSRDRLDDRHKRYGGSREHLDDHRERSGGSRDRLDDRRYDYDGNHDHPDDRYRNDSERYQRSQDGRGQGYGGSRDRLDYSDRNQYD
ncbi:uncharacterized protein KZ484_014919 [Pholidichthys leucotaenia]